MSQYVDGYVIPILKRKLPAYRRMAAQGAKVWRKHGALEYRECVGEDLNTGMALSFGKGLKLKPGETVVFSWIVFKSRAHRDRVNASAMKDPVFAAIDPKSMPFDCARMLYGGFETITKA